MRVEAQKHESLDDDFSNAVMVSWEFYDGYETIIDVGFDRITRARIGSRKETSPRPYFLDILHVGPPTPSPRWAQLTQIDDYVHPHDIDARAVMYHYHPEPI
ncbi:hypothetical protein [Mycobacterium colombiense]